MTTATQPFTHQQLADAFDAVLWEWVTEGVPVVDRHGSPVLDNDEQRRRPMRAIEMEIVRARLADCGVTRGDGEDGAYLLEKWRGDDRK